MNCADGVIWVGCAWTWFTFCSNRRLRGAGRGSHGQVPKFSGRPPVDADTRLDMAVPTADTNPGPWRVGADQDHQDRGVAEEHQPLAERCRTCQLALLLALADAGSSGPATGRS